MRVSLRQIEWVVASKYGLTTSDMRGPARPRRIARPRQIAMFLARELTGFSLPQIGRHFHRDHTTVISAVRRIAVLQTVKPKVAIHVEECRAAILACRAWPEPDCATADPGQQMAGR